MTTVRIVPIVEGHGEVESVRTLLHRIWAECLSALPLEVLRPIRIPRSKLIKEGELERAVELARLQTDENDGVLVLVDADDDCPKERAPQLLKRAQKAGVGRKVSVVLAKCEYEAWFLAAAVSIRGQRGLPNDLVSPPNPEEVSDAKGWLSERMSGTSCYSPTLDQPALTAVIDLAQARTAPSFDKLYKEVCHSIGAA